KLGALLAELRAKDIDLLTGTGFDSTELDRLISEVNGTDLGEDPGSGPLMPEAVSRRGEIYQLGSHRLMCGDSASTSDVDTLLAGATIHLVNMDPPYNVRVEPRSNNAIAAGLSSFETMHHQGFDLARNPKVGQATSTTLRAKDRPLENDFVSDEQFEKL